jgi:hypothetical protein
MDNLGFLIVNLKMIPKEADVPKVIDAKLTARIEFDMERSFGIGRQTLVLGEEPDEKAFLKKADTSGNTIFSGSAYVRAVKIQDDSVDLMVYDTALKGLGSRTNVKVGQISSPITLRGTYGNLVQDQFRLQVDSIVDPQRAYAEAEVSIDGSLPEKKILYKGSSLYSGSSIKVADVSKIASGLSTIESVKIEGSSGTATAIRNYSNAYNVMAVQISKELKDKNYKKINDILNEKNYNFTDVLFGYTLKFDNSALSMDEDYPPVGWAKANTFANILLDLRISPQVTVDNNVITVKFFKTAERENVDVCTSKDVIYSQNAYFNDAVKKNFFDPFFNDKDFTKYDRKSFLCSAIDVFKKVASSYGTEKTEDNEPYAGKAYYMIGLCYEELSKLTDVVNTGLASKNALTYYKRAQSSGYVPKDQDLNNKVTTLGSEIISGEEHSDAVMDDNGREVVVHLLEVVNKNDAQIDTTATISVNNGRANVFRTGDSLFPGESRDMSNCRIKEIRSTSVIIENCPKHNTNGTTMPNSPSPDITLNENVLTNIENFNFKVMLLATQLNKQVSITVLPGSGQSFFSESTFEIHVPVEKRAIELNPDKIDDKVNKTEEQIKKLNEVIDQLDKLIKSWKAVCLATFAYLTLKNSFGIFGGGASRVRARENVMVENGWRKYCEMDSGSGKTYKSYDDCIFDNSDRIGKNIDTVQKAYEAADKNYKKGATDLDGVDITGIREFQKASGEDLYSEQNFKNLVYLKELNDNCKGSSGFGSDAKGKPYPDACADVSKKYADTLFEIQSANTNLGAAVTDFKKLNLDSFEAWKKENPTGSLSDFLNKRTEQVVKLKSDSQFKTFVERSYNTYTQTNKTIPAEIIKGSDKKDYWVTPYGTVEVSKPQPSEFAPVPPNEYYYIDSKGDTIRLDSTQKASEAKTLKVSSVIWSTGKTAGTAYNPDGTSYRVVADSKGQAVIQEGPFNGSVATTYAEASMGDVAGLRQTYNPGATYECYEDGKPYCIPLSKGNFVKVLEFYKDGSPKTMNIWNVGPDGRLCTDDDVPAAGDPKYSICAHSSSLENNKDCSKVLSEVQSKLNSAARFCKSKTVLSSEDGHKFKYSVSSAAQASSSKAAHCEDAMEIGDCKLMFAVCDPVMCPASRFNLAGNWQVDDVAKTGIIGSIVLGLPNFPTDPVPICLTGVSAGLKNIRSVLQAYKDCLITMKVEGKSVGICDKIRSIYLCQILWQEAIAIFKVKGGLLDVIGKMFGNSAGGGEYFGFSDNFANVEKSVNYFTQSYASSVFAAHKGKSLDEVGTEVCKSAVYGKIPGMGDYIDHLTEPENPPQFTALFDEMPYSATQKQSQYSVYYHVYAGTDVEVQYSVYLKDPSNRKYYVTEQCERRSRSIKIGSFADFSVTCVTDTGYTQICVDINGKESCGFGKVSTAFSLNYINDLVVQDEAKRQITKVSDCVPGASSTSPSLGSVALPGQISLLTTGIVRLCSFDNPGKGANYNNWKVVGTCIDTDGKSWGSCWMDMSTVSIKDVSARTELEKELEQKGIEVSAAKKGIPESALLKADASKEKVNQALTLMTTPLGSGMWTDFMKALATLQEVIDLSIDPQSIADATYNIGVIYYKLGMSPLPDATDIKNAKEVIPPDLPRSSNATSATTDVKKEAEVCWDGNDNDGDGLVDCADPDCDQKYNKECLDARDCVNAPVCVYARGRSCICTSGPCCDDENCDFFSETHICSTDYEYKCEMYSSGPDKLMRKTLNKYCNGKSSSCEGNVFTDSQFVELKTCGVAEKCGKDQDGGFDCLPA